MKNLKTKLLVILCSSSFLFSQQLQDLSNTDLDNIKKQLINQEKVEVQADQMLEEIIVEVDNAKLNPKIENFGYNYFSRDINFFDNVPTPPEFKLGPGDEIILSLWGETNSREKFILNREGSIFYKNIGLINLNNKTLEQAELILSDRLVEIYSTINSSENATNLMLEIGKIKSINVYVSGETKSPGINLIHPFSDIFSVLNQVGISELGSLRNIELIRNGKSFAKFDFYSFFVNGVNNFSDIRILDGDMIHIPVIKKRVQIVGEIKKPMYYELLDSDSIINLIEYAGGLTELASSKIIIEDIATLDNRLTDDVIRQSKAIDISSAPSTYINNGAIVNLLKAGNNDINVQVYGRVTIPGTYPKMSNLKEVLDLAGGFDDPIFSKSIDKNIVVLRLDENKFYGNQFVVNYNEAEDFSLEINDQIFVYEDPNYYKNYNFSIAGEINRPGTYPIEGKITLSEAINLAGGITEKGSINSVSVLKNLKRFNADGNQIDESELVGNIGPDFEIDHRNLITIFPITNVVRVSGNIYNPGLVAHNGSNMSMATAIELAGGHKPNSLKKNSYVIRANGEIEKVDLFRGRAKRVFPGDSIFVPLNPEPQDFNISLFIAELSSTLANLAAILILVDRNSD
tara:strand:- start:3301 stop:5187 length:1887 start_codon:yes stop_codon:yes gene_type:complete